MAQPDLVSVQKIEQLQQARHTNDCIANVVRQRRGIYLILTLAFLIAAIALFGFEQFVFGLCALGSSAAMALMLLDAHGHLHEVKNRRPSLLVPQLLDVLRDSNAAKSPAEPVTKPT